MSGVGTLEQASFLWPYAIVATAVLANVTPKWYIFISITAYPWHGVSVGSYWPKVSLAQELSQYRYINTYINLLDQGKESNLVNIVPVVVSLHYMHNKKCKYSKYISHTQSSISNVCLTHASYASRYTVLYIIMLTHI